VYLGGTVRGSGLEERIEAPFIEITIWQAWSTLAGRTFELEHFRGGGFAAYCSTDMMCERLEAARISFDDSGGDHLRGAVDLLLHGRRIARSFKARRLDIRMMCG
jgi:hypothetical protein